MPEDVHKWAHKNITGITVFYTTEKKSKHMFQD
jgi:hypothetical protein